MYIIIEIFYPKNKPHYTNNSTVHFQPKNAFIRLVYNIDKVSNIWLHTRGFDRSFDWHLHKITEDQRKCGLTALNITARSRE